MRFTYLPFEIRGAEGLGWLPAKTLCSESVNVIATANPPEQTGNDSEPKCSGETNFVVRAITTRRNADSGFGFQIKANLSGLRAGTIRTGRGPRWLFLNVTAGESSSYLQSR